MATPTPSFIESTQSKNLGEGAREACKQISSAADVIRAQGEAQEKAIRAATSWTTFGLTDVAHNLTAQNQAKQTIKNIMGIDMSTQTIQNIANKCNNIYIGNQKNILDTSNCKYCQEYGCDIRNNIQSNQSTNIQNCLIDSILTASISGNANVQSVALQDAMQKADGLFTKNSTEQDTCNFVSNDMSSKTYFDKIQNCANEVYIEQLNQMTGCGALYENIQNNINENFQDCIVKATTNFSSKNELKAAVSSSATASQTATGLTWQSSMVVSIVVAVILGIVGVIIGIFVIKRYMPAPTQEGGYLSCNNNIFNLLSYNKYKLWILVFLVIILLFLIYIKKIYI
jgi:hypothetical protein